MAWKRSRVRFPLAPPRNPCYGGGFVVLALDSVVAQRNPPLLWLLVGYVVANSSGHSRRQFGLRGNRSGLFVRIQRGDGGSRWG